MSQLSICVFCGANQGILPAYAATAVELGKALAENQWRLVYGAGDVGLMGTLARATESSDGTTLGVIPSHLYNREIAKTDITQFVVTETMHERKKVMFMNCDVIVVLPGGAGSLDEFFEVLTWRQLALHQKPIYLLNTENYWAPLNALLDHIVEQGFADKSLLGYVKTINAIPALVAQIKLDLDLQVPSD